MNEKKVNRMLLYLIGFLCGHSAIVGMHPFMVPMLIAVYYMRQSTFGLFTAMLFGGVIWRTRLEHGADISDGTVCDGNG